MHASLLRFQKRDPSEVTPEFVRHKVEADLAAVYELTSDGEHLAWFVFERMLGFHTVLSIWICEGHGVVRHIHRIRELIHEVAKQKGCSRIRAAGRRGWERAIGYAIGTIYEEKL